MPSLRRRVHLAVALVGAGTALVLASGAAAHPLGDFTINHYAGLVIEPDRVLLDVVVDEAEVPAFQSIADIDTDGDATVSDGERDAAAADRCTALGDALVLQLDGERLSLERAGAGLSFPLGSSGIETLRLVCVFLASLPAELPTEETRRISFTDRTSADRLGWREIVVTGSGVRVAPGDGTSIRTEGVSARLTAYPAALAMQPLRDEAAVVDAFADPDVPRVPLVVPDVVWRGGSVGGSGPPTGPGGGTAQPGGSPGDVGAGDGGPGVPSPTGDAPLPSIFGASDLTPMVLLLSVLTALALGAGHALTPGHGKTLMAAYLVGTRGTPRHALGLGLSVSVSHTLGILLLAGVVRAAAEALPADLVVRVAPVIAAVGILAIGAWMLGGEWQRRAGPGPGRRHGPRPRPDHRHAHPHPHPHVHGHRHGVRPPDEAPLGAPTGRDKTTISWRSLFVLGLAGGLIPSTSALLILLGAIAAGRPAFGVVLVVAFGLGMAAVMGGIGLVLVLARERLDRLPESPYVDRARAAVPLVAAAVVFGFGVLLTAQALRGAGIGG